MMKVKLKQIAMKAKQDKRVKFTSLAHHINEANLAECYLELKRNKACGIEGVTKEADGEKLEEDLKQLVKSLKTKSYRPKSVKRVTIPKAGKDEQRKLGLPSVEDKLVQMMLKKLLESIFEADFVNHSYGFKPGKSCHDAIKALDSSVMTKPVNAIVEVDIRNYFDTVNHYWLQRCLEERVSDPTILWLVRRFLKAGIMEEGNLLASNVGSDGISFNNGHENHLTH